MYIMIYNVVINFDKQSSMLETLSYIELHASIDYFPGFCSIVPCIVVQNKMKIKCFYV